MIQIQLQPEVEAQLAAEAQARGMALDRYIVETLTESRPRTQSGQRSISDAIQRIRELRQGNRLSGLRIKDLIHEGHKY